jgi:glutamine synthetase
MSDNEGNNLLTPGKDTHDNLQFLVFCTAVIRAVNKWQGLLRASIASAGNDHRLGANEAPPAIISVFLGDVLTDLFEQIENGKVTSARKGGELDTGVTFLPKLPRDAGDRNRTSPFAFTGNKFEFRAVSSGQSIAMPNVCLNVAVSDALDSIATELEAAVKKGKKAEDAAWELLPSIAKQHKRIIFNGNNYADEWQVEAGKRGLLNMKNTVDALPELVKVDVVKVFEKHRVLNVEAQLTVLIASRYILPAALKYQTEVAQSVAAVAAAGGTSAQAKKLLGQISKLIDELKIKADDLAHKLEHGGSSAEEHAKYFRDTIVPAMASIRETGDALELLIPHGDWPLPTYREMLFVK